MSAGIGHNSRHMKLEVSEPLLAFIPPAPIKVAYGGRGSGKSQGIVDLMLVQDMVKPCRTLCAREFQSSIAESVHKLMVAEIFRLGLQGFYSDITDKRIRGRNGTEYIFKGLRKDINSIRSLFGIGRTFVEEAQTVTKASWDVLLPTVRRHGGAPEIWMALNPHLVTDETYDRFIIKARPTTTLVKMNWRDNPWFPPGMEEERLWTLKTDPEGYDNIWDGEASTLSNAVIFAGKFEVADFEAPPGTEFFYGADWGYAEDPSAAVRCFIDGDCLFIDYEAWGLHIEIDDLPALLAGDPPTGLTWNNWKQHPGIPGATQWPIKGDSASPSYISFLRNQGLNLIGAEKWPGSVKEGIAHLRGFRRIYIHSRCKRTAEEFRRYEWKKDKTGQIMPIPEDRWNHCIDALRYSLDAFIENRGEEATWKRLAGN